MQLFSNNAVTTLSVGVTAGYGQVTLTDGARFPIPAGDDYLYLTLTDGTLYEVVRCYGGAGADRYVERAQEGSAGLVWALGTTVMLTCTAGTLDRIPVASPKSSPKGVNALDLSLSGTSAGATGAGAIVLGNQTVASGLKAAAMCHGAMALGEESVAIGHDSYAETTALRSIALGKNSSVIVPDTFNLSLLQVATNWYGGADSTFTTNSTGEVIGMSAPLNFTGTLTYSPVLPTGITFYPTEVGVIVTSASGVTGQPVVRFGVVGATQKHIADTTVGGLTAAGKRHRFGTLLGYDGESALTAEVVTAAVASGLMARFYWRGFAVLNDGI